MTLEGSDIEKIQNMIDRAVERLEKRLDMKADAKEVNERFAATIERRVRIEGNVDKIMSYMLTQDEKFRQLVDDSHKEIIKEIKEANKQIDEVKEEISISRATTLRYIVGVIVSFIIGIVSYYALIHLR